MSGRNSSDLLTVHFTRLKHTMATFNTVGSSVRSSHSLSKQVFLGDNQSNITNYGCIQGPANLGTSCFSRANDHIAAFCFKLVTITTKTMLLIREFPWIFVFWRNRSRRSIVAGLIIRFGTRPPPPSLTVQRQTDKHTAPLSRLESWESEALRWSKMNSLLTYHSAHDEGWRFHGFPRKPFFFF